MPASGIYKGLAYNLLNGMVIMSVRELIYPLNSSRIFIDHQPQLVFAVTTLFRQLLKNNTVALAKAGKIFNVPVIYTSVEKRFSGYIWPALLAGHPGITPIKRSSMNLREDAAFIEAVKATGRKKLIFPALMVLEAGYEVYVVEAPLLLASMQALTEWAWATLIRWCIAHRNVLRNPQGGDVPPLQRGSSLHGAK